MSWNDEKSPWLKINEGETKEFTIFKIIEKQPSGKVKPIPNRTYYYEFDTDEGILTVNSLGLFNALQGAQIRENDKIRLRYLKKGSLGNPSRYEVTILPKDLKKEENKKIFEGTSPDDRIADEDAKPPF